MSKVWGGIYAAALVLLTIGMVLQQRQIASLEAEVRGAPAEAVASQAQRLSRSSAEQQELRAAVAAAVAASAPEGMAEGDVEALVGSTVEELLETREAVKKQEATDKWVEQASEGTLVELERVVERHGLSDAALKEAHDMLVESLYYTVELKQSLDEGEISVREAKLDGEAYVVNLGRQLDDVLGETASAELGQAIRPGKGWNP
ncbi:MAG: hypothetical protein AAGA48_11810 [Myxococcota bacterium]